LNGRDYRSSSGTMAVSRASQTGDVTHAVDWQTYLFDPQHNWIARLERVARRRLIDPNLADQALEQALAKLQENDWARLREFRAMARPDAFLLCVFRNLIEDFAIARFGKCRAPLWVQQLGLRWVGLHKRLCCERQTPDAVVAREARDGLDEKTLREICRVLKAKLPNCGSKTQFQSLDALQEQLGSVDAIAPSAAEPQQQHEQALCTDILDALTRLLNADAPSTPALAINTAPLQNITLDVDTRLLLKMVYQDDISLPKAAAILGIAEHNARRQIKRALSELQHALQAAGFRWQDWIAQHD